ncbi:MAG: flotillin domain-containing protein [Dongiaceae bacterium]
MNAGTIFLWIIIGIFAIAVAWWLLSRLYQRSRSDVAFVRTGFLGRKVVISGGAFVFPVLHEVTGVNMNSVRLDIDRTGRSALITKDRLRVDVVASFNVRVGRNADDVSAAAQTFGKKTLQPDVLRHLLENSFIDALRTVASEMTMEELHLRRSDIGSRASEIVGPGLTRAGMELQSLSITKLDQTEREYFNPENAFDAAGLTYLTERIEDLRRRRHEVEQDAQIAIEGKALASARQRLTLKRDQEFAQMEQERELSVQRSREESSAARLHAEINLETEKTQLEAQRSVEEARIAIENEIEERRAHAQELRDKVRIETDLAVQTERASADKRLRQIEIETAQMLEVSDVERRKQVELAEQTLQAELAERSRVVAEVRVATERVKEELARAEEAVIGAREIARAEAGYSVQSISSRQQAEMMKIVAEAEANVEKLRSAGTELRLQVEAAGIRARNEADNLLEPNVQAMRVKLELIEKLEAIIRESVKPLEQIEGLKILDIRGAGALPGGQGGGGSASGGDGNLADQLVNAALRYRGQGPLVDSLLKEIGVAGGDLTGLHKSFPDLHTAGSVEGAGDAPKGGKKS